MNTFFYSKLNQLLLLLSICSLGYAQEAFNTVNNYSWADYTKAAVYLEPFQGKRYFDHHRILNEKHKYFKTFELVEGAIIYNNDHYSDLQLKYDLNEQQLALYHPHSDGVTLVAVNMNQVQAFKIGQSIFVKKQIKDESYFLEYIDVFKGKQLWIYHQKIASFKMDDRVGYYEFNPKESLFVFDGTQWYRDDAIRIENFYPQDIQKIKTWSKEGKTLKKNDAATYVRSLLKHLKSS